MVVTSEALGQVVC